MKYPTLLEAQTADREQLCKWWRFLPLASDKQEQDIMVIICERYHLEGGFTPEISKSIGWGNYEF